MRQARNLDRPGLVCGLLVLGALAVYLPVLQLAFINYDDDLYVTANLWVRRGLTWEGVGWAFSHFYAANWHPLTWLSHMLDVWLFGLRPAGHHIVNALFHAANGVVLFLWLRSLTGACWRSALVAALFVLHPAHVESVAWVAERKDVLCGFFGLLSLWAYASYARGTRWGFYFLSLFLFALGLLCKPMLVTWPCVMLLLDYWPLGRFGESSRDRLKSWRALALEKTPFFVLAAASSVVTFLAQKSGAAVASLQTVPLGARLANALVGYIRYLGELLWPGNLAVIYPLSRVSWGAAAGAALLLLGFTCVAFRRRTYVLVGWLWFLGTLTPVIGLVQAGNQSIADRYTYLPAIGLFIIVSWAGAELAAASRNARRAVISLGVASLIALAFVARLQVLHWRDSGTLFHHALAVTRDNFVAWNNLGQFLAEQRELREAESCYRSAVEINPSFDDAWYNLGCTLADLNRNGEAIPAFETALRLNPRLVKARNNLAAALAGEGRIQEAEDQLRLACGLDPRSAAPRANLGSLLAREGKWEAAAAQFQQALELDPGLGDAQCGLAGVQARQGRYEDAIRRLSELLRREPANASARLQLAGVFTLQGRTDLALEQYTDALQANPGDATAHYCLAALLRQRGDIAGAISHYQSAIEARPGFSEGQNDLAWILATAPEARYRNTEEAVRLAESACQSTAYHDASMIDTLAAAYAGAGRFPEAVACAQKALALAQSANDSELAAKAAKAIEIYRAGRPYRDAP